MKIYKDNSAATIPAFATSGSACFDLEACLTNIDIVTGYSQFNQKIEFPVELDAEGAFVYITPGSRVLIPTGLIFDLPPRHVLRIYPRSSTALKKGLILPNSVGIIDSDYVDPTYLLLMNVTDTKIKISSGERLCQAELLPVYNYVLEETHEKPKKKTERNGGLGSTG
jgi:dUTP pyrophosphatase